jgi:hypothetical protein
MQRKLLAALLLTIPGSVLAADLIVGTWKLNLDKSHFSPSPAPKRVTMRISEDGDWLDSKTDAVDETGKPVIEAVATRWKVVNTRMTLLRAKGPSQSRISTITTRPPR